MSSELVIHNSIYAISAIISFVLSTFVLSRNPKQLTHRLFFVSNLCYLIFTGVYITGLSLTDPVLSQSVLFFTIINVYTVTTTAHLAFATFNLQQEHKLGIRLGYIFATALVILYAAFPESYVSTSQSFLYFPSFFTPGMLYGLFVFFFAFEFCYFVWILIRQYSKVDLITQKRILYFLIAFVWAYGIGSFAFLPVFGLDIDPLPSALIGLYTIPLAYGLMKYELMDIRVVAKKALLYGFLTFVVGFMIIIANMLNERIVEAVGVMSPFVMPLVSAAIMVLIGWYVWRQMRGADSLKYEFINNISHKFRTPLTHVRWLAEELRDTTDKDQKDKLIEQIQFASMRLFELTNTVIDVSRDNAEDYLYRFNYGKVQSIIENLYKTHEDLIAHKKLHVSLEIEPKVPEVVIDKTRLQFAIQILLENALIYTPDGGYITIKLRRRSDDVECIIKDNGIGISPLELENVFSKFYRTQNARHADTEGMGIGLFMAKSIIEKHGGKIWAESEGDGRGATFIFTLPLSRHHNG